MAVQIDPKEHADVIIGACYGNLECAWTWALENRKVNPKSEEPYWDNVAEEIASRMPEQSECQNCGKQWPERSA